MTTDYNNSTIEQLDCLLYLLDHLSTTVHDYSEDWAEDGFKLYEVEECLAEFVTKSCQKMEIIADVLVQKTNR